MSGLNLPAAIVVSDQRSTVCHDPQKKKKKTKKYVLFDRILALATCCAQGLVDAPVCATADEADDAVFVANMHLSRIAGRAAICGGQHACPGRMDVLEGAKLDAELTPWERTPVVEGRGMVGVGMAVARHDVVLVVSN